MRHDRRAKYADADVEHCLVRNDMWAWHQPRQNAHHAWLRKNEFGRETAADDCDERYDDRLDITKAFRLQIQYEHHVRRRDDATPHQRNSKQQLQSDGRTHNLSQIARCDGQLADDPEKPDDWRRVMIAARLREVASCGDTQFDT